MSRIWNLTEDAACNLRGDIVILSLFTIVIFVYSGVIPSRKARHSYRFLNKADILLKMQTPSDRRNKTNKGYLIKIYTAVYIYITDKIEKTKQKTKTKKTTTYIS